MGAPPRRRGRERAGGGRAGCERRRVPGSAGGSASPVGGERSGCRVRAASSAAAVSHVKDRSCSAEEPRYPAVRGLPLCLALRALSRTARSRIAALGRRRGAAPVHAPHGVGVGKRRGRPSPAAGGCAREEPPSPPSPSSPPRGGRGGRRDDLTPGRAGPGRAMEGMTRFVVAAAQWRPALPALLSLLLAVPALRGSPAAGKGTKRAWGAGVRGRGRAGSGAVRGAAAPVTMRWCRRAGAGAAEELRQKRRALFATRRRTLRCGATAAPRLGDGTRPGEAKERSGAGTEGAPCVSGL